MVEPAAAVVAAVLRELAADVFASASNAASAGSAAHLWTWHTERSPVLSESVRTATALACADSEDT